MEKSNNFPESFVPSRPCEFEATFSYFTVGSTERGDCPIAVLTIDGRERSLWLWQSAIRSGFRRARPKKGERLEIRYAAEKVTGGNGRDYWPDEVDTPDRPIETIDIDHPLFAGNGDDGLTVTEEVKTDDIPF